MTLQPVAAQILMKILYAASMARLDFLRAGCKLARSTSRWGAGCDKRLHRLICYIQSTKDYKMTGWVGDKIEDVALPLYADADFAGCAETQRSTSGVHLSLRGLHACLPLSGISKG